MFSQQLSLNTLTMKWQKEFSAFILSFIVKNALGVQGAFSTLQNFPLTLHSGQAGLPLDARRDPLQCHYQDGVCLHSMLTAQLPPVLALVR